MGWGQRDAEEEEDKMGGRGSCSELPQLGSPSENLPLCRSPGLPSCLPPASPLDGGQKPLAAHSSLQGVCGSSRDGG